MGLCDGGVALEQVGEAEDNVCEVQLAIIVRVSGVLAGQGWTP